MLIGLTYVPTHFQYIVKNILSGCKEVDRELKVVFYLDDTAVLYNL